MGRKPDAVTVARQAVDRFPESDEAHALLAEITGVPTTRPTTRPATTQAN